METETAIGKLTASRRIGIGKEFARKLRTQGLIPAVCYGLKEASIPLTISPVELKKSLDPKKRINTVIDLTITDTDGKSEQAKVMVKDYQVDSIKRNVIHADFIRVSMDQEIEVMVPLELEGRPKEVKMGGTLHQVFRTLPVKCTPDQIPESIILDTSELDLNDSLRVKDVVLPPGVVVNLPGNQTLASIVATKGTPETEQAVAGEAAEATGQDKKK